MHDDSKSIHGSTKSRGNRRFVWPLSSFITHLSIIHHSSFMACGLLRDTYFLEFLRRKETSYPFTALFLQGTTMLFICARNSTDNGTIFFRTMSRNNTNTSAALTATETVRPPDLHQTERRNYLYLPSAFKHKQKNIRNKWWTENPPVMFSDNHSIIIYKCMIIKLYEN